ncbi:MAG: hypothetical protein ABI321_09125 [Polyangia bacterium]
MIADAWALVRREPRLPVILFIALVLPSLLGLVPFDRALAPWLDLAPTARGLQQTTLDDTLLAELFVKARGLSGALTGGVLVALLVAGPAVWLVEVLVALRATESRMPTGLACARGLGVVLVALPLRTLPAAFAPGIAWSAREAQSFGAAWPALAAALVAYAVTSAFLAVLVDVARGVAITDEARGLWSCLGVAVRGVPASLVLLELASMGACIAAVACTHPLGLFNGATLLLGLAALAMRASCVTIVVAAAATSGAASRSA